MAITIQNATRTTYQAGFPGMLANGNTQGRPSGTVETVAGIAFGAACFQGAADRGITSTPGTKFKGIAVANAGVVAQVVNGVAQAVDTYAQYQNISFLDMGDIYVTAGSATTPGAAAYVTSAGVITAAATGNTAIPASFLETVTSGNPVKLRVVQQ
jgi:hypothetical protein